MRWLGLWPVGAFVFCYFSFLDRQLTTCQFHFMGRSEIFRAILDLVSAFHTGGSGALFLAFGSYLSTYLLLGSPVASNSVSRMNE